MTENEKDEIHSETDVTFRKYFEWWSLLPRPNAPEEFKAGFNNDLYELREASILVCSIFAALPAIFILLPPEPASIAGASTSIVYVIIYGGAIIAFSFPFVRRHVFYGWYSHWVVSVFIVLPYVLMIPFSFISDLPFTLPVVKSLLLATLLILGAAILHVHATLIAIFHFTVYAAMTTEILVQEDTVVSASISATLAGVVFVILYAAFYRVSYIRCYSYLVRVQAVKAKVGTVASTLNNSFIRQVLHDFGTPLSTLTLGIGEFSTTNMAPRLLQCKEEMRLACWHLNSLRDRAMQFAKEPLHFALPSTDLSIIEIRDFIYNVVRPLVQAYGHLSNVELSIYIDANTPNFIQTEADWLLDILLNIFDNAFEYTTEGTITLYVKAEHLEQIISFMVADTGPGIDAADRERIFQPFFQGKHASMVNPKGTGLGLWSVYMKTKALGGTCRVSDNVPRGTRFTVLLPVRYDSDSLALPYNPEFLANIEYPDAAEAESAWVEPFLAESADTKENHFEHTPTGEDGKGEIMPSLAPPPEAIQPQPQLESQPQTVPMEQPVSRSPEVLVVEDQLVIRRLFRRALEKHNIVVDEAPDGLEGLKKLQERAYDCVFSDILMPKMDGQEMVRQFRLWESEHREARQLIMAVSATSTEQSQQEALASGMDEFCVKPVDIDAVLPRIFAEQQRRLAVEEPHN